MLSHSSYLTHKCQFSGWWNMVSVSTLRHCQLSFSISISYCEHFQEFHEGTMSILSVYIYIVLYLITDDIGNRRTCSILSSGRKSSFLLNPVFKYRRRCWNQKVTVFMFRHFNWKWNTTSVFGFFWVGSCLLSLSKNSVFFIFIFLSFVNIFLYVDHHLQLSLNTHASWFVLIHSPGGRVWSTVLFISWTHF